MDFSPENGVSGAGGGFFGALLSYFGFKSQIDRLERELSRKADSAVCQSQHEDIKAKFSDIKEDQVRIFDKLDEIKTGIITGKWK